MGGGNSTIQTTTIVNDFFNKSVSTVMTKNVMMAEAAISTDQDALNITADSVGGNLDLSGLSVNQEANLTMDLEATMKSIDNTEMMKDIAMQMANDAEASSKEQDSVIPAGLFGGGNDTNMKTEITNSVSNIIESNVSSEDVKKCCSSLDSIQRGVTVDVGQIDGDLLAVGMTVNQKIDAATVQKCSFGSEKTTKIIESISNDIDNKLKAKREKQNLIGSAGSAVSEGAQGIGKGIASPITATLDGIGNMLGMDTGTVIMIGVVAIAGLVGAYFFMKNKGDAGGPGEGAVGAAGEVFQTQQIPMAQGTVMGTQMW